MRSIQSLKKRVAKLQRQIAKQQAGARRVSRQSLDEWRGRPRLSEVIDEVDDLYFSRDEAEARGVLELEAADLLGSAGNVSDSKAEALLDALETIFEQDPARRS